MYSMALDLEMNQPSGSIIQIGWAIVEHETFCIVNTGSVIIRVEEQLSEFIIALTGITQEAMEQGVSLWEGFEMLRAAKHEYQCQPEILTWGGGDTTVLKQQLLKAEYATKFEDDVKDVFAYRYTDVKTIFQAYMIANGRGRRAGLSKSLNKLGMRFYGTPHNAMHDALNTIFIWTELLERIKDKATPESVGTFSFIE